MEFMITTGDRIDKIISKIQIFLLFLFAKKM